MVRHWSTRSKKLQKPVRQLLDGLLQCCPYQAIPKVSAQISGDPDRVRRLGYLEDDDEAWPLLLAYKPCSWPINLAPGL